MAGKKFTAVVAVALCACVLGVAAPARAADATKSTSARARVEQKRSEIKTKRAERKDRRDVHRDERKSFLRRLWPFGKDKKEEPQPFIDRRFGTGNPRDTSSGDKARVFGVQKRSKPKTHRDGMDMVRSVPKKKHGAQKAKPSARAPERRDDLRAGNRKNGEFRRDFGRPQRHAPAGLNLDWRLPQREQPRDTHSHKNGAYRLEKRRR